MKKHVHWICTGINPNTTASILNPSGGRTGWCLHAFISDKPDLKFSEIEFEPAACGLVPGHGWDLDPWINRKCKRCTTIINTDD